MSYCSYVHEQINAISLPDISVLIWPHTSYPQQDPKSRKEYAIITTGDTLCWYVQYAVSFEI